MKKLFNLLILTILIVSCKRKVPLNTEFQTSPPKEHHNVKEASVEGFKYNGKYINPLLIGEFNSWISDEFPYFRELDLTASNESNRFYMNNDPKIKKDKIDPKQEYYSFTPMNSDDETKNEHDFTECAYKYLGTLANGVQVIYYFENLYGSYQPAGIYGFRFNKEKVKGDTEKHLFMRLVNNLAIHQNVRFQVDAPRNRVIVIPKFNLPTADYKDMSLNPSWVEFN
jgi:hypothetical protein